MYEELNLSTILLEITNYTDDQLITVLSYDMVQVDYPK